MKNDFKICTVVQGNTLETFLKNLKKVQATATSARAGSDGMVELRADSINDFGSDDLPILKEACSDTEIYVPAIFTFRHKKEGGLFKGSVAKQREILEKAFDAGFTYIDVALNNPLVKELSVREKKHLLLSYHNNKETPSFDDLWEILDDMIEVEPAIIKIATFVHKADDVTHLAAVLIAGKKYNKITVIGMGVKGGITRYYFPEMGSYIAYVTMEGDTNIAPGMITEEEFSQS
jgi:3-dehydroquinate dehydratase type I